MAQEDPGTSVISALVEEYRQRRKEVSSKEKPVRPPVRGNTSRSMVEQWYLDNKIDIPGDK